MSMQSSLEEALQVLPDKNKLCVLISKRAKQLSHGAHPLVDVERNNTDYIDIAIKEVIGEKIWYQEYNPE